jgi:hypothetical protein
MEEERKGRTEEEYRKDTRRVTEEVGRRVGEPKKAEEDGGESRETMEKGRRNEGGGR